MSEDLQTRKVAVLIDAENISSKYAKTIINEAKSIGNVVCRRIYGDWSSTGLASWKQSIMDYSINAIQQFQNTSGKNSSDSALIIDAMDLMHEGKYQSICIVSSDSDFTKLASRLREAEIYVVGMGEQKTPTSFRSACDKFLYLDVISKTEENQETEKSTKKSKKTKPSNTNESQNGLNQEAIIATIDEIIESESAQDEWILLTNVGIQLYRKIPDFDVRNFGCKNLTGYIEQLDKYEIRSEPSETNPFIKVVYVRKKVS